MNRRQRRAAWQGVLDDAYEHLVTYPYARANPITFGRLSECYWEVRKGNPYDRDWDQWYEDGEGTTH